MKVVLEFDPYEDRDALEDALHGGEWKEKFESVWQEIFRPRHKHGYQDKDINDLLGLHSSEEELTQSQKDCNALLDLIETLYQNISAKE